MEACRNDPFHVLHNDIGFAGRCNISKEDSFAAGSKQGSVEPGRVRERNNGGMIIKTRARSRSPTPRRSRLADKGGISAILRKSQVMEETSHNNSKTHLARDISPYYERLAASSTRASQLRRDEMKENNKNHQIQKLSLPRMPSPCHERLAASTTKASQLRYEQNKRDLVVARKLPPRAPSPCLKRLAVATTKSAQLRNEERKANQRTIYKRKEGEIKFYRSTSPLSDYDQQSYDVSTISSYSSFGDSEDLSYKFDKEKLSKSYSSSSLRGTKKSSSDVSSHYDRLANTPTKNMELRRHAERELNQKKLSSRNTSQSLAAFNSYLSSSSSTLSRKRSSSLPSHPSPSRRTQRSLQSPSHTSRHDSASALKKKHMLDSLFHRLSKQDTIASSRKTNGVRPVLLTQYEKVKLLKQRNDREEKKRSRGVSQKFFDGLHKDVTMSMLFKEYDEAKP